MAIYRQVQLSFWSDEKVLDEFTPEDKYFYLYLFTNPQTNLCGCYELGWTQTVSQLGYNKDTISRLLDRFETVHKVIRYSKETKEVLILNWYKYNWQGGNQTPCIAKEIEKVKDAEFKQYLSDLFEERLDNEGAYKGLVSPHQATVTVTDNNTVNISNSIKEIIDYFNQKLNKKYTYKNKNYNASIKARLDEGFTVEDFKTVIDKKYDSWFGTEYEQYLTPDTLFRPSKFEKYLNEEVRKGSTYGNRNGNNTNSEISDAEERGYLQIEAGVSLSDLSRKWMGNLQS